MGQTRLDSQTLLVLQPGMKVDSSSGYGRDQNWGAKRTVKLRMSRARRACCDTIKSGP